MRNTFHTRMPMVAMTLSGHSDATITGIIM
jgi:hypothetical protein